jgi:hypothetical protein
MDLRRFNMNKDSNNCIFSQVVICVEGCFELLEDVWTQIPKFEKIQICKNLGLLAFARFDEYPDDQRSKLGISQNKGGVTSELEGKCFVRIDMSRSQEIIKETIALELAHVLYNHPVIHTEYLKAEAEAGNKASEWGF